MRVSPVLQEYIKLIEKLFKDFTFQIFLEKIPKLEILMQMQLPVTTVSIMIGI